MADFTVTFTGHSLGGALASLAAARTVLDGFRTGDRVKVYTFGQPRTGSAQFGANYDRMIKNRYTVSVYCTRVYRIRLLYSLLQLPYPSIVLTFAVTVSFIEWTSSLIYQPVTKTHTTRLINIRKASPVIHWIRLVRTIMELRYGKRVTIDDRSNSKVPKRYGQRRGICWMSGWTERRRHGLQRRVDVRIRSLGYLREWSSALFRCAGKMNTNGIR